jgi:hypothetical protein
MTSTVNFEKIKRDFEKKQTETEKNNTGKTDSETTDERKKNKAKDFQGFRQRSAGSAFADLRAIVGKSGPHRLNFG